MSQNRILGVIAILCVFLLILPGASSADDTPQLTQGQASQNNITFGFRIMGGGSLLMRNDFNDHLQGLNDLMNDSSDLSPESEFELIRMGTDFSGEILLNFMPNFSIGIGAGYFSAEKETSAEMEMFTVDTEEITYNPKFSAVPITLSFYYGIPVGSALHVALNAGFGYYLGTVNYDLVDRVTEPGVWYEETETWSAKSNAFGFHGGIDLEFGIAPNLALVVGAKGRYAKLIDLTGDLEWQTQTSFGYSDSGTEEGMTLWFGDYIYIFSAKKYPRLAPRGDEPTSSYWSDVRKAEVNLSGIVFQAGIKITF
jgi:hypothetical protein